MPIIDTLLRPTESTLIKWIGSAPGKSFRPRKLATVGWEAQTASRAGWMGIFGLTAYLALYLIADIRQMADVRQGTLTMQLSIAVGWIFIHTILGIPLGLGLLLLIKRLGLRAKPIVLGFAYCAWPISMALLAPLNYLYGFLYIGLNTGVAMLCLVPRWQQLARNNRKGRYFFELLVCSSFSLILVTALGFPSIPGGAFQLVIVLMGFILIPISLFDNLWNFGRVMAALQHPDDHDGWRTTLIMMCFLWLWPIWLMDRWGKKLYGYRVTPRTKPRQDKPQKTHE